MAVNIMTTSSARSRGAILILLVAFCLTITLWVSYERAMTVSLRPSPKPEIPQHGTVHTFVADQHDLSVQHHVHERDLHVLRNNITLVDPMADNRLSPYAQPDQSGFDPSFPSAGKQPATNFTSIAVVDLYRVVVAYVINHPDSTNAPDARTRILLAVQSSISNQATLHGYSLVLDTSIGSKGAPASFATGTTPDITQEVIQAMNGSSTAR